MGIPIGWNIERDDAPRKDILRADVSGERSPIRRRIRLSRSPRSHSTSGSHIPLPTSSTRSYEADLITRRHPAPPPVPELSRSDSDHTQAWRSRSSTPFRSEGEPIRDVGSRRSYYEFGMRQERRRRRLEASGEHARAQEEQERPLPALTPGFAPAAASSEDARRDSLMLTAHQRERLMARQREREAEREVDRHIEELERQRRVRSRDYRPDPFTRTIRSARSRSPSTEHRESFTTAENGIEVPDGSAVEFPPLRRMGRRTITDGPLPSSSLRQTWSPVSTVDGLGDRQRSVSPLEEQPPWDNFLTTVVPDPVGPTTESSFASTAAAASFSNSLPSSRAGSNSAASSRTHITVPSRHGSPNPVDQFIRACDTSEDEDTTDMDTEDEAGTHGVGRNTTYQEWRAATTREAARRIRRSRREIEETDMSGPRRRRIRLSLFSDEPPARDSDRYSSRVFERATEASNYVRNYHYSNRHIPSTDVQSERLPHDQLDGPTEQTRGEESPSTGDETIPPLVSADWPQQDQELRDARALLERLSRREDISDNFWASVGLTRSFADLNDSVERTERESERDV